ncbi:hypothetical protein Tco_0466411 [Tanacetum coccineum]
MERPRRRNHGQQRKRSRSVQLGRTIRGYDTIFSKWKNSIRPKIAAFSVVYDSVQRMDENGSSNLVLFQNALAEFETGYGHPIYNGGVLENFEKSFCLDSS